MSIITLDRYIDINEKYASYDNDGYYIDPVMILVMISDNLSHGLPFSKLKEHVMQVEVAISQEKLNNFLAQKGKNNGNMDSPKQETKNIELSQLESRYSYTLDYFKTYLEKRKKKCAILFDVYEDIESISKNKKIKKQSIDRLQRLNVHFNDYGYVYYEDVLRLTKAIVFNIRDLYEKTESSNHLEAYLDSKVTKESLDNIYGNNSDFYFNMDTRLLDIPDDIENIGLISLSKNQAEDWKHKNAVKQKSRKKGM